MTYSEFEMRLEKLNLSKKDFAKEINFSYAGIINWKQVENVPKWVESWLYHYEKSKILDNFIESIKKFQG